VRRSEDPRTLKIGTAGAYIYAYYKTKSGDGSKADQIKTNKAGQSDKLDHA
jgi:hypothetical protein